MYDRGLDYRMDPTRIARRSSRSVLAVATTIAIAVVVGVLALAAAGQSRPEVAVRSPAIAQASVVPASRSPRAAVVPVQVRCHDVPSARCRRIAEAGLSAAIDPALPGVTTVDVWATIGCDNNVECPPYRLTGRQAAGSVVIGFGTPLTVWVNVTQVIEGDEPGSLDGKLDAWVVDASLAR